MEISYVNQKKITSYEAQSHIFPINIQHIHWKLFPTAEFAARTVCRIFPFRTNTLFEQGESFDESAVNFFSRLPIEKYLTASNNKFNYYRFGSL